MNLYMSIQAEVATLSDFFCQSIGISTSMSAFDIISFETQSISFQSTIHISSSISQIFLKSTLLSFCSSTMIFTHSDLRASIASRGSAKYSQSTKFSAQIAVLDISFLGGIGVNQVRIILSNQAQSQLLIIAPTLRHERILSKSTYFLLFCI